MGSNRVSGLAAAGAAIILALYSVSPAYAQGDDWGAMIERISSGIVSLDIDVPRAFDTDRNQSSQATGFVVDIERGLILTNRHVISPGPVRGEALFLNREEVELVPVYRDPVHDFGFFRFDPKALKYFQPAELPLVPERAAVGVEVRIVGNDAGEHAVARNVRKGTVRGAYQWAGKRFSAARALHLQ